MNDAEIAAGLAPTPGYRYADRVGDELYVAGQVPLDAAGELVGIGDVTAQSHQCLHNLDLVLHTSGFGRADLRRLSIHVVGEHQNLISAWQAMHEAFDGEVPPATLLGTTCLGYADQLVEIDAVVRRMPAAS